MTSMIKKPKNVLDIVAECSTLAGNSGITITVPWPYSYPAQMVTISDQRYGHTFIVRNFWVSSSQLKVQVWHYTADSREASDIVLNVLT